MPQVTPPHPPHSGSITGKPSWTSGRCRTPAFPSRAHAAGDAEMVNTPARLSRRGQRAGTPLSAAAACRDFWLLFSFQGNPQNILNRRFSPGLCTGYNHERGHEPDAVLTGCAPQATSTCMSH